MLHLQEGFNQQVQPFLNEDQRRILLEGQPLIILFQPGDKVGITTPRRLF